MLGAWLSSGAEPSAAAGALRVERPTVPVAPAAGLEATAAGAAPPPPPLWRFFADSWPSDSTGRLPPAAAAAAGLCCCFCCCCCLALAVVPLAPIPGSASPSWLRVVVRRAVLAAGLAPDRPSRGSGAAGSGEEAWRDTHQAGGGTEISRPSGGMRGGKPALGQQQAHPSS